MNFTRRSFLLGAAHVTAAVAVASTVPFSLAESMPILYGDGIHDDTHALQTLFDGKPVRAPDGTVFEEPFIRGGEYRIRRTIYLRNTNVMFRDAWVTFDWDGTGEFCAFAHDWDALEKMIEASGEKAGMIAIVSDVYIQSPPSLCTTAIDI